MRPDTVAQLDSDNQLAKLGEYAGLIFGCSPGSPFGLSQATSLFIGLKRPCIDIGRAEEVYTYITNPEFTYTFENVPRYKGLPPIQLQKPKNSVFATYVAFYGDDKEVTVGDVRVDGEIRFWEWVLADPDNPLLPDRHEMRYDRQLWLPAM